MKEFTTAARRGTSAVTNPVDIEFMYDDHKMTAHPPTTGQIVLFVVAQGEGGTQSVRALFDLLAAVLDDDDYAVIETSLREGVDVVLISEIINYLIGEWSARPTGPSPASASSRNGTGRRSTAKRPARASTTSS